ncbi:TPA: peptide ABC transporter ATP-binding protein, partial [Campylobacter jejuni]|nr:peptide ABC transporter ATP-binding protein [Campylobacter jejuni]EAI2895748.1 peptide ABC transporter ATP-binding protein [Campylobacter jejuni]EAK1271221.1 peptide ABC transporter ATP-binding protein [Campylobacter jejuni]EFK9778163.1 peptide ABC transporter ATP-binding protein [Campylobacter jejuni]EFS8180982.1 peptide ABC transporter ATP-binding protein [Campylobacter jejuni]
QKNNISYIFITHQSDLFYKFNHKKLKL